MIFDRLFRKSGGARIMTSQQLAERMEELGVGAPSASGVRVTRDRALRLAAFFACVRVLAESVGQLPLQLYERRGEREKVKAVDHPLYRLLHVSPNEYMTSQEYWEWSTACLATGGNAYSQINSVRGVARELWPWSPDDVTPKKNRETGEVTYDLRQPDGTTETLPAWEVFHLKLFPLDGLVGAAPLTYARESIGSGIAAEQHGAGQFARGAFPGGVIEVEQKLSEVGVDNILGSWKKSHEGSQNAGRVGLLHDGAKFKAATMPASDMQWIESRKFSRSEIAGLMRVPPHKIGDLEHATFSNIEEQELSFWVDGLMPYLTRIEQRISLQLVQPKDQGTIFAKFNAGAVLRGNMAARAAFYTSMVQNGAYSSNDVRELEDLNPREGGDAYLTPANMTIWQGGQPQAAPAGGAAGGGKGR